MIDLIIILILVITLLYITTKYIKLKGEVEHRARQLFNQWRSRELEKEATERAKLLFEKWRIEEEERIREDAIKRSIATIIGKVGEQLAPILICMEYGINPKDLRFIGSPIDYIAFKGFTEGKPEEITFIEVKSGKTTTLSQREKWVKDLVEKGKVRWLLIHIPAEIEKLRQRAVK